MKIENKHPEEWKRIIELVERMQFGEVTIKVQNGKIYITEYTIKKKPGDVPGGDDDELLTMEL